MVENGVLTKYMGPGGDVTIPDGVTKIGEEAFTYCYGLSSITLPDSVTEIGSGAFSYGVLTSLTFPRGVTKICSFMFNECDRLESVTIPSTVTEIEGCAFEYCASLQDVYFDGTKAQWDAITFGKYTDDDGNDWGTSLESVTIHYNSTGPAELPFTDVPAGAAYARAVDWAVANGITNGDNLEGTMFNPDKVCTRGHIVTFLHRAYVPGARPLY